MTTNSHGFGVSALMRLALPLALTVGCFSITLFTDRTLLMWYGPTSSAASVAAGNLYWTFACVPVSALGFITPLVAIAVGGRREASTRVWSLVWQGVWLTVASIPGYVALAVMAKSIFISFGHEAELADAEARYFQLLIAVAPASMLEATLTSYFVARRVTRPILITNIASAAINIVLDAWLIFGGLGVPALGVRGAAIATAVAMWIKVCIFIAMLFKAYRSSPRSRRSWYPKPTVMWEIVGPGSTLGIQQLVRSGFLSFVLLNIGTASVVGLAATSAAMSLYQLLSIPALGLTTAITVLVGQSTTPPHHGVLRGQVAVMCMRVAMATAAIIGGMLLLLPDFLVVVPMLGVEALERRVLEPIAVGLLRLAAIYAAFDIVGLSAAAICKGLGRTSPILFATGVSAVAVGGMGILAAQTGDLSTTSWWLVLVGFAGLQLVLLVFPVRAALDRASNTRNAS